jgi:hypothetical protein
MSIGASSPQAGEESLEIMFIQAVGAVDNMEMWYGDTSRGFGLWWPLIHGKDFEGLISSESLLEAIHQLLAHP